MSVIAGQAWYSYFSKVNLLFKKSYCGMSECNCFGTPLLYLQQFVGLENIKDHKLYSLQNFFHNSHYFSHFKMVNWIGKMAVVALLGVNHPRNMTDR